MQSTAWRHWIFDLDGTLTIAVHDFDAIRQELGLEPGRPILETIAALGPDEQVRVRRRLDVIELELARRARPQPGAAGLLGALAGRGCRLGIVTRNSEHNAMETLVHAGLAGFFARDDVVGRESCRPKPSPDGVHKLLAAWGADAGTAVVVGDYRYDLEAGSAAGTATVHFDPSGRFPWHELADHCIDELDALLRP